MWRYIIISFIFIGMPTLIYAAAPARVLYDVPFTSQAPYADWRLPYQEACEEAAVIMANAWAKGQKLSRKLGNSEIKKLVAFQKKQYGDYKDTNAAETARFAREFYGLDAEVRYDIDHRDIRLELAKGNLVIAPMAGRLLKNPYFTPPGPIYHMLLFIGYDDTRQQFIVNDPGTRRGKQFRYAYKTIDAALHDLAPLEIARPEGPSGAQARARSLTGWIGAPETITKGRRAMIVIEK